MKIMELEAHDAYAPTLHRPQIEEAIPEWKSLNLCCHEKYRD